MEGRRAPTSSRRGAAAIAGVEPRPRTARASAKKQITVIAVIDDGLAFANRNFRDKSGRRTRVEFCWLQSVKIDKKPDKPSVLFGREYTREQIDKLIECHGDDEDALYREAGATDDTDKYGSLLNRHATHGAHVMDLATGYAPERGERPPEEIRIIAVQLPNMVTVDTSGVRKDIRSRLGRRTRVPAIPTGSSRR